MQPTQQGRGSRTRPPLPKPRPSVSMSKSQNINNIRTLPTRGRGINRGSRGGFSTTRTATPPPLLRKSSKIDTLNTGFVASQQLNGKQANAKEFYKNISSSILQQGLQLQSSIISHLKIQCDQKIQSNSSQLLISSSETSFLLGIIHQIQHFLSEQKNYQKIILLQSSIRWWIIRKRFQKLRRSKEEKQRVLKRNSTFIEFMKTEQTFVNTIDDLVSKYVIPLRQTDIIEPQEGAYLFCNIETLLIEHKSLISRLKQAQCTWPFLGNIGHIFLDIKSLLNALSVYVGHFKTAMNELVRMRDEKPRFQQFINQRAKEDENELQILLTLPVNRVGVYELFLNTLSDYLEIGSEEKEDCEVACAALGQSSIVVQRSLIESRNTANMLLVQRKLRTDKGPLAIIAPGRIYIQEFKFKKYYTCLFSDVILVAKKESLMKTMKTKESKEIHKVKSIVNYDKTSLKSDNKSFELNCDGTTYKFNPLHSEDKQNFINAYNKAIEEVNRIKVFNVPLIDTIIREESSSGIPSMLEILANYIKEHYYNQPGIFRVAGSAGEMAMLKQAFDSGEKDLNILKLKDKTPFSICDTFKLYFRSLPEPLLGFALYEPLLQIMRDNKSDDETVKQIQEAIFAWTPPFAIKVLRFLMSFLNDISKYSEENKMTSTNISIVFGPTLLWPEKNTLEAAMDMPYINSAVKVIIENYSKILN